MKKKYYVFIGLLAIVFALIGGAVLLITQRQTKGYVKIDAVVVGYDEKKDYDNDYYGGYKYMYSEKVEYVVDGVKYEAQNNAYTNAPKAIGKKIEIAYDPQSPSKCVFIKSNNLFAIVFFVFSGVLLLSGVVKFVADSTKGD